MTYALNKPISREQVGCRLPESSLVKQTDGAKGAPPEGTIIRGAYITNGWYFRNPNVTFVDCIIEAYSTSYGINAVKGNLTFNHCTFRGGKSAGISSGDNTRISYCLFTDMLGDGAKLADNCVFEYNWIELIGGPDNPDAHADGIQARSGKDCIVRYNVFDLPVGIQGPKGKYRNSACLMLQNSCTGWDIYGNWFAGGQSQFDKVEQGENRGFQMQISSDPKNPTKLHDNVFVRGNGLFHQYRLADSVVAYNNRWAETGEYFDGQKGDSGYVEGGDSKAPLPDIKEPKEEEKPKPTPEPDEPKQPEVTIELDIAAKITLNPDGTISGSWKA